jgi:hypothetical protein
VVHEEQWKNENHKIKDVHSKKQNFMMRSLIPLNVKCEKKELFNKQKTRSLSGFTIKIKFDYASTKGTTETKDLLSLFF